MNNATGLITPVIKFDVVKGDPSKTFKRFKTMFMSQSGARGFGGVCDGTEKIPKANDAGQENDKKRLNNKKAFAYLLLSVMDEEEAFDLVDESRSPEFPDGNVKVALENLEREYTEEPDKEKERYQEQLDESEKLKPNEDPTKILTRLHIIQKVLEKRFEVKVTDREIWRKLLRRLPEQYSVEKTVLTIKLDARELSKKILDSTLGRKYDDIKKGKLSEEVESTENEGAFVG